MTLLSAKVNGYLYHTGSTCPSRCQWFLIALSGTATVQCCGFHLKHKSRLHESALLALRSDYLRSTVIRVRFSFISKTKDWYMTQNCPTDNSACKCAPSFIADPIILVMYLYLTACTPPTLQYHRFELSIQSRGGPGRPSSSSPSDVFTWQVRASLS